MKRKLLSLLVLLMTAISVAWGQEESYLYLEVNPGNNTAVLRYGQVPDNTPYYVGGDNNVWSGDPAKSSVTTITVAESCKNFAGKSLYRLFSGFNALTTINGLTNLYTANVTNMGGMFEGCSLLTSLTFGEGWNTASVTGMAFMFDGCSSLASLDLSGWNTSMVTDMSGMFYDCENLESLDVSGWNTAKVTNMEEMFKDCSSLASLNISGWNTANVTKMNDMFYECSKLPSLDLSGWNTAKVTYMNDMFNGCSSLASLDLSGWNTAKVTYMNDMFRDCSSLASLDLSGWNTANVNNMKEMFRDCSSLENIYVGDGWSTKKVNNTWSSDMFKGCTSLPNWNENATDATKAYVGAGGYLTSWTQENLYLYLKVNSDNKAVLRYGQVPASTPYYVGGDDNVWSGDLAKSSVTTITVDATCKHFAGTTLRNLFNGFSALTTINGLTNLYTASVTDMIGMFSGCSKLASLDLSGWNTAKVTDMSGMFYDCKNLATLTFGDNWSTAGVNGMVSMFNGCSSLASLDLSSWNTGSVTDMSLMFLGCSSLASLTFGEGWNTGSVTDMSCMFFACSQLENIYVGDGWSTDKVTSSDNMFSGCTKLPNWDNENPVTDKTYAYAGDGGYLTSWTQENLRLYLKVNSEDDTAVLRYGQVPADTPYYDGSSYGWVGFDDNIAKSSVTAITVEASCQHFAGTSLINLFNGFSALTTINDLENLHTANVENMSSMFLGCSSLASLDLSGWNTESVTDMSGMFLSCSKLASLDLSGWNTAKVTNMGFMFCVCSKLENIYVGDGWSTDKVTSSDDMFTGCTKLPNFNSAVVDKTHANTGAGGYLTATTYNVQAHEGAKGEYWATFYSAISNYQAPEGTQVFTVNLDGTSITMKEIGDGIVESGQGVVLKASTADGINLTPTNKTATGDFSGNSLQGTTTSKQNPGNAYVLNYKEGTGAGFYKLSSTGTIGANKAYLIYGSPAQEGPVGAPAFFSFDNTTGIVEMRNEGNEWNEWNGGNGENGENAIWYDLNGRRLQGKPAQKGLYIVNGKKVIIK